MEASSQGVINYIIFYDPNEINPLVPPGVVTGTALTLLKLLPKNLYQLKKAEAFFKSASVYEMRTNYNVFFCSTFPGGCENVFTESGVNVVLWEKSEAANEDIKSMFLENTVFIDVHMSRLKMSEKTIYNNFILNVEKIVKERFSKSDPVRKLFLKKPSKLTVRKEINFNPLINNYMTIRQIIGPYEPKPVPVAKNKEMSRSDYILETINLIDTFHKVSRDEFRATAAEDDYFCKNPLPALIVIAPWINSTMVTIKNIKRLSQDLSISYDEAYLISKSMLLEQDVESYKFHIPESWETRLKEKVHFDSIEKGNLLNRYRVQANDNLAFLHSSFSFSPVYRLPLSGSTIDKELAWFSPVEITKRNSDKDHFKRLLKVGQALGGKFNNQVAMYIKNRMGPLCVVSDLPIEWTEIEGVPLFFSHDVCRMPETSFESSLSEYVKFSFVDYKMPVNILEKTLVVCTNPSDPNIRNMFEGIKKEIGSKYPEIRFEYARSIKELSELVDSIKPELLIIDTHGNARLENRDSYLVVEDELLTGSKVIEHNICAPLVILSSCLTAPAFGYVSPIAHAFFEAGALSVLSSVLPLSMTGANVLYARILNNLKMAADSDIHDSWLDFISHNLRTSYFDDLKFHVSKKLKTYEWIDSLKYNERVAWQVKSILFKSRRESFFEVKEVILKLAKSDFIEKVSKALDDLDDFKPDAFAYTLFGRADLIKMPKRLNGNPFV